MKYSPKREKILFLKADQTLESLMEEKVIIMDIKGDTLAFSMDTDYMIGMQQCQSTGKIIGEAI